MTRINTIPVEEINSKMLLAEYVELPRVFTLAARAEQRGHTPVTYGIPDTFTLNAGHVKFFTDKLIWLEWRFTAIVGELLARGYNLQYTTLTDKKKPVGSRWYNDWQATATSQQLIYDRIHLRLQEQKYTKRRVYEYVYRTANSARMD